MPLWNSGSEITNYFSFLHHSITMLHYSLNAPYRIQAHLEIEGLIQPSCIYSFVFNIPIENSKDPQKPDIIIFGKWIRILLLTIGKWDHVTNLYAIQQKLWIDIKINKLIKIEYFIYPRMGIITGTPPARNKSKKQHLSRVAQIAPC